MIKTYQFYDKKQKNKNKKKIPKKYMKAFNNIFYELAPLTRDVIYSRL